MADTKTMEAKISIKVFVDKVKKKVLYAEADHSFVDILFNLMTLPLGTIVRILGTHDDQKFEAFGSLNNLYQSLKDFPATYFATEGCKIMLLNPRSVSYDHCKSLQLKIDDTEPIKYFICGGGLYINGSYTSCKNNLYFSIFNAAKCIRCGQLMSFGVTSSQSDVSVGGGVFVSDIATFIVTDDFSVIPYSAAGVFQLLTDLGITDTSHLEEKTIDLGSEQMLYLLKIALSLGSPLTRYVFQEKFPAPNHLFGLGQIFTDGSKEKTSASLKMVLEVSLQKSTGKFLFAESKEDFVDFVFGFLSIPLGTVIGTLLNGSSSIKCMDNIFISVSNMSVGRYLKSQDMKDTLVKPHFGQQYVSKNQLFPLVGSNWPLNYSGRSYYMMDTRSEQAFLRQNGMFFVTDDLCITPSSSHLAINTLNKLKVKLDDIEKCEISIGLEEGLKMLKASLRSSSTLTSIIENQVKK